MNQKDIIKDFFHSINTKNFEKAFSYFHEDLDWFIIGDLKVSGHGNKKQMELGFKMLFRSFTSFEFILHEFTEEENRVAVIAESKANHKKNQFYNNHYHFLISFKDDKIHRVKEYLDTKHAAMIESL